MRVVDVVVPCYNYAGFLPRCVTSILSQEGVGVRVLVIDDTSTDATPEVGARLAAEDSRVEFRRHASNMGHIATYNEGLLGWARSPYSMLLSADDALAPGALARAVGLMEARPDIGMAYGMAIIIGDEGDLPAAVDASDEVQVLGGSDFIEHCCQFGNPVPTPTAVVRTRLQQEVGGYRADLPYTGDMEMWMRFAIHGPVGVFRATQGFYRWHAGNMSTRLFSALLSDQRERLLACLEFIERWGDDGEKARHWRTLAARRVGEEAFWLSSQAFDRGDVASSESLLAFAVETCPALRESPIWSRFRLKRLVGYPVWSRVQPLVRRARGRGEARPEPTTRTRFQMGEVTGWWPASGA